jgi:hypothetical protein
MAGSTVIEGEIDIVGQKINLYKFNKTGAPINIYPQVTSIEIYESIYNYTLTCDVVMQDGIDLLNHFPIAGEEIVEFSIQTPGKRELSYTFLVESVVDYKIAPNSMQAFYTLRCVTMDFLRNSFTLISKRYTNQNYDVAVRECLNQDLQTDKPVEVEGTKGKFDFVVNSVRPFQIIDLLLERSVSASNKSSHFVFYEDVDSYRFLTIEKLINDRKGKANELQFYHDVANRVGNFGEVLNFRNILEYQIVNQGSSVDKVRAGNMNREIRQFDVLHGDYFDKYAYVNVNDHSQFAKMDASFDLNSDAYSSFASQKPAASGMVFKDGTRPEMQHNKNIVWQRPFSGKIEEYSVNMRVYGDTDILVGDVVKLNLPEATFSNSTPKKAERWSENYLITQLRHTILKQGSSNKYISFLVMDLRKPNANAAI